MSPRNFASVQTGGQMSPHDNASPSHGTDTGKKGKSGGNQSLTPLTIKQLYSASQATQDDIFKLDGKELNHVPKFFLKSKITFL